MVLRLGCALESCNEGAKDAWSPRYVLNQVLALELGDLYFKSTLEVLMPATVKEALIWERRQASRFLVFCHCHNTSFDGIWDSLAW